MMNGFSCSYVSLIKYSLVIMMNLPPRGRGHNLSACKMYYNLSYSLHYAYNRSFPTVFIPVPCGI